MAEAASVIELRAERVSNLFDPFDPFPIPSRDLAPAAEEFVADWARELPPSAPLKIRVHLADAEECALGAPAIAEAIARHFTQRAERIRGDLHELFRIGRVSLLTGLGVLTLCLIGGRMAQTAWGDGPVATLFSEGLIILGWVANWRPLEIFLYDWWPLVRRRRLYQRLAAAPVELKPMR